MGKPLSLESLYYLGVWEEYIPRFLQMSAPGLPHVHGSSTAWLHNVVKETSHNIAPCADKDLINKETIPFRGQIERLLEQDTCCSSGPCTKWRPRPGTAIRYFCPAIIADNSQTYLTNSIRHTISGTVVDVVNLLVIDVEIK